MSGASSHWRAFFAVAATVFMVCACGARTPLAGDGSVNDAAPPQDKSVDSSTDVAAMDARPDALREPGSPEWAKLVGHLGGVSAIKVAAYPGGGYVLVGVVAGTARLGGGALASNGRSDVVVARFDANGQHVWSTTFGGERDDMAHAVAVDSAGNIVVVGMFDGSARLGGATLASHGGQDAFVARLSRTGTHLWSKVLGGKSGDVARAVAVDGAGNVTVTGSFRDSARFGGATLTSSGIDDVFVARYSADGQHLWSAAFGGTGRDYALGVAADGAGNTVLTGYFERSASFGGATLSVRGDRSSDVFLARYDAAGRHLWSKSFGGTNLDVANAVVVDAAGNVTVAGAFAASASFGGATLTSAGHTDVFVARYSASGQHQWSARFGGTYEDEATALTVDAAGSVTVAGRFAGKASFGGATFSTTGEKAFVARYDANGQHVWSTASTGAGTAAAAAVAVDSAGIATISGRFSSEGSFDGPTLSSTGTKDVFVARYGAKGEHRGSWAFGDSSGAVVKGAAIDTAGNVIIVGHFAGDARFGGAALSGTRRESAFLARYSRSGEHVWSKAFGGTGEVVANGVAVDASGRITVTGHLRGSASLGGATLTSKGLEDVFVARYSADGQHLWSRSFGDTVFDFGQAIAVDGRGNLTVAGHFHGTTSFGGATFDAQNGAAMFVARYSPAGQHIWSIAAGAAPSFAFVRPEALALDRAGNVTVVGHFSGGASFGGAKLASNNSRDVFIAHYDGAGQHLWSKAFGGPKLDVATAVAADSAGNIIVGGYFAGSASFGGATFTSKGGDDAFVAHYSPSGAHLWSKAFGGKGPDRVAAVGVLGAAGVVVGGRFQGDVGFGGPTLAGRGSSSAFVARYDANGAHSSSRAYSGAGTEPISATALAVDRAGALVITGQASGVVDFGQGPMSTSDTIFVARLAP